MYHAEILIGHLEKWSEIGQWPAAILYSAWYDIMSQEQDKWDSTSTSTYLGIVDAEGDEGQAAETELKGEPEDDAAEQPCEDTTAVLQNCLDLVWVCVCVCVQ